MAKTSLLMKEHLKGEMGQAKRGTGDRNEEADGFSRQDFYTFI